MSFLFMPYALALFSVVFCIFLLVYLAIITIFMKQSSKQSKLNLLFVFVGLSVVVSVLLAYYMILTAASRI